MASLRARSKRESNTWNSCRWKRSRKARCAFRSCGYSTSSVTAGAGIEIARRPPPRRSPQSRHGKRFERPGEEESLARALLIFAGGVDKRRELFDAHRAGDVA